MGQRREAPSLSPWVPKIYHLHKQDATQRRSGDHGNNSQASRVACYSLIVPVTCGPHHLNCQRGQGLVSSNPTRSSSLRICNSSSAYWELGRKCFSCRFDA